MNPQEILKAIVLSDSQDERMELAEQLAETMEQKTDVNNVEAVAKITELETALNTVKEELSNSKKRYIDRFFGGEEKEEKTEETENKKEDEITTEDIVERMGK
jgi:hypothetical protein